MSEDDVLSYESRRIENQEAREEEGLVLLVEGARNLVHESLDNFTNFLATDEDRSGLELIAKELLRALENSGQWRNPQVQRIHDLAVLDAVSNMRSTLDAAIEDQVRGDRFGK